MKTISLRLIAMAFAIGIFASSCRNQDEANNLTPAKPTYAADYARLEENRVAFAKVLARAIENEAVRSLLKREAEKQFDQDTEVLFHLIKDEPIDQQTTLFDYLAALHGSKTEFKSITNSLPLLTILVPHLVHFTAEKWDVRNHVPIVAALASNNPNGEKITVLPAFNASGKEQSLQKNVLPTFPVLVVKDNERLYVQEKNTGAKTTKSSKVAYVSGDFSYIFTDESFDARQQKRGRLGRYDLTFDQRVRFAYENNLQYHRDYVYYGIAPELGIPTGSLNQNYGEFITAIKFNNTTSFSNVYDDPSTDWSDGNFEFTINVYFVDDKTKLGSLSKGFSATIEDLYSYTNNADGSRTITGVREYTLPGKGVFIQVWDMQKYGDTWKFSCFEQDQQVNQTYSATTSVTSSFGSNYTNGVKDGANFGGTSTAGATYSQTYSISITGGPDQLYDGILRWQDKVILNKSNWTLPPFGTIPMANSYAMDTGVIQLSVEPRYRY